MIKFVVMFHKPQNLEVFETAYRDFLALVERMPHFRRYQAVMIIGSPQEGGAKYYRMLEIYFDTMQIMQQALLSPAGQEAANELARFGIGNFDILYADIYEDVRETVPADAPADTNDNA